MSSAGYGFPSVSTYFSSVDGDSKPPLKCNDFAFRSDSSNFTTTADFLDFSFYIQQARNCRRRTSIYHARAIETETDGQHGFRVRATLKFQFVALLLHLELRK